MKEVECRELADAMEELSYKGDRGLIKNSRALK